MVSEDAETARQIAELRKRLRSLEDRLAHHAAQDGDPLASETAFLTAVRVAYARAFETLTKPLRMRASSCWRVIDTRSSSRTLS